MKTEFLKGLGIEDEVITKIMAENGKENKLLLKRYKMKKDIKKQV